VRQWFKCGRLGHPAFTCKSSERCKKSGDKESLGTCILFNAENHSAKDRQICPIRAKEQDINKIMTIKKIARKEVLSTYSVSQNYSLLENYYGNFSPLNNEQ